MLDHTGEEMKTEEAEAKGIQSKTEHRKTPTPQLTSTKGIISSSTEERGQEQLAAFISAHHISADAE